MSAPIRVALVDDQALFRTGIRMLISSQPDLEFVGEAADGAEGVELVARMAPDVVLMDIRMPVMDGIAFIKNVRASGLHNSLPILILTTETSQDKRDQGKAAGGTVWIVKPFDPEKLISVIHRVVH